MIRLGVRLAVAGGREAVLQLAMVAVAVAVGVGLLLATRASTHAFETQNQRYAWLETDFPGAGYPAIEPGAPAAPDDPSAGDLWWRLGGDRYDGEEIIRVEVAADGPEAPIPPGIPSLPAAGEAYVSPALADLLASEPSDQLGDRYPQTIVGTVGAEALPSPDTLLIVAGDEPDALAAAGARRVDRISTTSPSECSGHCAPFGTDAQGLTILLTVVAAALLVPVLVFIGGATRLSATRREQRFAAMRLIGATPRQIAVLATVESAVATVIGVAAGFGLFAALRPFLAEIPFTGERFTTGDLALTATDIVVVAVGIPVAAAVAARVALRRVTISPLGVTRRTTPPAPRAYRLVPLLGGIAWLGYLAYVSDIGASRSGASQAYSYLVGIVATMIGLVVAGPWLTLVGSRLLARRAGRPVALIAARRLGDDPKGAFRAVSGLVMAVFVASCAIGTLTTIVAYNGGTAGDTEVTRGTVVHGTTQGRAGQEPLAAIPAAVAADLAATPGVEAVATIHVADVPDDAPGRRPEEVVFYATCADMAAAPALGHCPAGAETAFVMPHFGGGVIEDEPDMAEITWPAGDLTVAEVERLPVDVIVVATDASTAAVERVRTILAGAVPTEWPPMTPAELTAEDQGEIDRFRQLANVVLLASLPIAGCSLAVNVAGSLAARRRPFRLLRLSGVPLGTLRRVVAVEAVVPLVASVAVSAAAGLLAAALFLRAQLDQTLQVPGVGYYAL
ncbi:MAG TPA: FtsX-like permease family protein, partial [Iamia sp.]